jgi:hypothetical protein
MNSDSVHLCLCNKSRVPHISLVFREMWDSTNLDLRPIGVRQILGDSAEESHISRKTSEIWGPSSW